MSLPVHMLVILLHMCTHVSAQCTHGQWQCPTGQCLLNEKLCDQVPDCEDGSDEAEDTCQADTCQQFLFQCVGVKQCVSRVRVCNGKEECEDGSDEKVTECDREDFVEVDISKPVSSAVSFVHGHIMWICLVVRKFIV